MEIKESISILQTPEKIWEYLLLVITDVEWRGGIIKAELTSQSPSGVGSN